MKQPLSHLLYAHLHIAAVSERQSWYWIRNSVNFPFSIRNRSEEAMYRPISSQCASMLLRRALDSLYATGISRHCPYVRERRHRLERLPSRSHLLYRGISQWPAQNCYPSLHLLGSLVMTSDEGCIYFFYFYKNMICHACVLLSITCVLVECIKSFFSGVYQTQFSNFWRSMETSVLRPSELC